MKPNSWQAATATACANIALIKYWGKQNSKNNLPAVGSISLTLDALKTETSVQFDPSLQEDIFTLNEQQIEGKSFARVSKFLDIACGAKRPKALINSTNSFATSAGLASSASGFAALALAVDKATSRNRSREELSRLARQGSGSAARSVYGGFAEMRSVPDKPDENYAVSLFNKDYWDVRIVVAVTSTQKKEIGSTEGMKRTARTSPYYEPWLDEQPTDIEQMRAAIEQKDFEKLGQLAERSCFKMHGLTMSAQPPWLYWNDTTVKVINRIQNMRKAGTPAYITIDAGPQVKIICLPDVVHKVTKALQTVDGVQKTIACKPGGAATVKSFEKEQTNE